MLAAVAVPDIIQVAESKEEAMVIITKGKERGEGEEIKEKYNWKSENITKATFIENLK